MELPLRDDADVWGEPFSALPSRPVKREALQSLSEHRRVDAVRVPVEGGEIVDDSGPVVTGDDPRTVSEFMLITSDSQYHTRFGYPEVQSGEVYVPRDLTQAVREGYVRWWQNEIHLDVDEVGGDGIWTFFEERTEELTR